MSFGELAAAEAALRPDHALRNPRLRQAADLLNDGRYAAASRIVREHLEAQPADASGFWLLAEIATRQKQDREAERLVTKALQFAPNSVPLRHAYGRALLRSKKFDSALRVADELVKIEPTNPLFQSLRALACEGVGDNAAAGKAWKDILERYPDQPDFWRRYGHVLRAAGARAACIDAYRKAIEIDPAFGHAYWALANLKTYRFTDAELALMEEQLAREDLSAADRVAILFSLGRAYGDRKEYQKSFAQYARANALQRLEANHDPDLLTRYVARCKRIFTPEFFAARRGHGCDSREPIFLVGMMRAGSTLVEQILASHSQVEGTRELFELAQIAGEMENEAGERLPEILENVDVGALGRWGGRYHESVRVHRRQERRPFFLDKMGANFVHVGLLHLILPRAKIVDVRRHPLACGFSNFAEYFASGQNFAYRLPDIGRMYRDYVELMAHFDRVLPGKVHRVFYEQLIEDPEREVRRLLDYLALPFETSCLQFYNTGRVLTTASSEQVRQPIYRAALEQWRNYEPWLGPLKAALGPVLEAYPAVPEFS